MEGEPEMEGAVASRKVDSLALKLDAPTFNTEAEEAAWWPTQEGKLFEAVAKAAVDGTLQRVSYRRKGALPTTTIRLEPTDIELAKQQAASRGLRYQTYLKMIIHEALRDR